MDKTTVPTRLFIGQELPLENKIYKELKKNFCELGEKSDHCFCAGCRKIKNNQHPSVVWIEPEKNYVLGDLSIIFEKIRFSLDKNQSFFFILKKVDRLSTVCANKLLKTLEEPPPGYHFCLLANNAHAIIPTIRSRCTIHYIAESGEQSLLHPLLTFFVDPEKMNDPFYFEQELKRQKPSEQETIDLLYNLTTSIQKRVVEFQRKAVSLTDIEELEKNKTYNHLQNFLSFLQEEHRKPPQAGSASLFWKKLFLTFPRKEA